MIWFDIGRYACDLLVGGFLFAMAVALSRGDDTPRGDGRPPKPMSFWLAALLFWTAGAIAHCQLGGFQFLTTPNAGQWNFYSVGWPLILIYDGESVWLSLSRLPTAIWMTVLFLDLAISIALLVSVRLAARRWWTSVSQGEYRRLALQLALAGVALWLVLLADRWLATPRYLPTSFDLLAHLIAAYAPWYIWGPIMVACACLVWMTGWMAWRVAIRLAQARAEGAI